MTNRHRKTHVSCAMAICEVVVPNDQVWRKVVNMAAFRGIWGGASHRVAMVIDLSMVGNHQRDRPVVTGTSRHDQ